MLINMMNYTSNIQKTLNKVYENIPHSPTKVVIVTVDGLPVAEVWRNKEQIYYQPELPDVEGNYLAPMSAAILSLGERVSDELHGQKHNLVCIGTPKGIVLSMFIGEEAVLSINWLEGLRVESLYQSWDELQKAIKPLRDLLD